MLKMPPANHYAAELIDKKHLADLVQNYALLLTFRGAIRSAKNTMLQNKAIKSVYCYALRANDELWLLRVGPRGGWRKVWNFGKVTA